MRGAVLEGENAKADAAWVALAYTLPKTKPEFGVLKRIVHLPAQLQHPPFAKPLLLPRCKKTGLSATPGVPPDNRILLSAVRH
jgi:hypothetical protein